MKTEEVTEAYEVVSKLNEMLWEQHNEDAAFALQAGEHNLFIDHNGVCIYRSDENSRPCDKETGEYINSLLDDVKNAFNEYVDSLQESKLNLPH